MSMDCIVSLTRVKAAPVSMLATDDDGSFQHNW